MHDRYESLKTTFEKQVPALQQKFLNDLIEGRTTGPIEEVMSGIRLRLPYSSFQIAVMESVDFTMTEKVSNGETVLTVLGDICSQYAVGDMCFYYVPKHNNMAVFIVNSESRIHDLDKMYEFVEYINGTFDRLYNKRFTIGIGKMYANHNDVPLSYVDALMALQYKVVKGQGQIIFVDEVRRREAETLNYSMDMEKQLMNKLKTSDLDHVKEALDRILEMNIDVQHSSPELIQNLFRALAGTIIRTIYDIEATTEEVFGGSGTDLYAGLDRSNTLEDKRSYIIKVLSSLCRYIEQRNENQYEQLYNKIKEYVELRYHQELSLPQLGEALNMSPTYLSSKFKEITGVKFVDFVNIRRIEQAKLYLQETDETINGISEKVGFVNSNTFIKVFKKHEGITPGQFRSLK